MLIGEILDSRASGLREEPLKFWQDRERNKLQEVRHDKSNIHILGAPLIER